MKINPCFVNASGDKLSRLDGQQSMALQRKRASRITRNARLARLDASVGHR
jgi:hypothetical protein